MDVTAYLLVMLLWLVLDACIALIRGASAPAGTGRAVLDLSTALVRLGLALYTVAVMGAAR